MKWTTEQPTREGWYWYRGFEGPEPSVVFVEDAYGAFWIDDGSVAVDELRPEVEWAGPIEVPS